jgi:eukaryotic-like serine/threonine-protein kinase
LFPHALGHPLSPQRSTSGARCDTCFARRNARGALCDTCCTRRNAHGARCDTCCERRNARELASQACELRPHARELARTLLFEIDNQLVNVTGALPARRLLVERGLSYLDKLAAQAGDDPDLLEELAVGYVLIGDVQGDTQRPNIGDYDGALESYQTALSILDEDIGRMNPRARHTQYLAVTKMGDQLVTRNDHAGALEFYRRSLQIAIERDNLAEQGTSHGRLADTLSSLGRKDSAREHRRESQRITNELAGANPEHLGYRRDLAVRHFETGIGLLSTDPAAALEQFTTFVSISEELAATDPDHAVYQRDIAVGSQRMGHALEALGRLDDALPLFERELEIIERLAAADPDNFIARAEVAAPCAKIGEIYLARGDLEHSMHFFQQYLDISTACAQASPSNAPIQRDVGVAYYKMNQWHARQARDESLDLEARLTHWREAKQWLQRCYDHFIMLRDTNLLRPVDAAVPDVIAAEIAQCDEAIAKLLRGPETE